jgi:prophage antirepressor-like protein
VLAVTTDNVRRALDADEVKSVKLKGLAGRALLLVSESGLYALILRSNKPAAKFFRKWVTGTVLPALRKDGMYVSGEEGLKAQLDLVEKANMAMELKIKRLEKELEGQAKGGLAAQLEGAQRALEMAHLTFSERRAAQRRASERVAQ